jgi:hypothetical protein
MEIYIIGDLWDTLQDLESVYATNEEELLAIFKRKYNSIIKDISNVRVNYNSKLILFNIKEEESEQAFKILKRYNGKLD